MTYSGIYKLSIVGLEIRFNVEIVEWWFVFLYFRTGNVILNSCHVQVPNLLNSLLLKLYYYDPQEIKQTHCLTQNTLYDAVTSRNSIVSQHSKNAEDTELSL